MVIRVTYQSLPWLPLCAASMHTFYFLQTDHIHPHTEVRVSSIGFHVKVTTAKDLSHHSPCTKSPLLFTGLYAQPFPLSFNVLLATFGENHLKQLGRRCLYNSVFALAWLPLSGQAEHLTESSWERPSSSNLPAAIWGCRQIFLPCMSQTFKFWVMLDYKP